MPCITRLTGRYCNGRDIDDNLIECVEAGFLNNKPLLFDFDFNQENGIDLCCKPPGCITNSTALPLPPLKLPKNGTFFEPLDIINITTTTFLGGSLPYGFPGLQVPETCGSKETCQECYDVGYEQVRHVVPNVEGFLP